MFSAKGALFTAGASVAPVAYDALGTTGFTGAVTTNFSYNHTIGSSATAIVLGVGFTNTPGTVTAKVGGSGGTAMTQLALFGYDSNVYYVGVYGLLSPPTGTQSIYLALTSAAYIAANSVSYTGVTGFGTAVTAASTSTSAVSESVSSATNEMVFFATGGSGGTAFTSVSGTTRYSKAFTTGTNSAFVISDAAGSGTVNLTATASGTIWGAVGVNLI